MDTPEFDERLLVCQECDSDFIYTIEEQEKDSRESRELPRKCHRCRSGGSPKQQPGKQQSQSRKGGRDAGRERGRGRARDPFREEYRSPSFRDNPTDGIYRSPAFSSSDPTRQRERSSSGGGGGGGAGRGQGRSGGGRPRYQIVCSNCGRNDTIPFKPSPSRPVFCHECYESQKMDDRKGRN